MTGDLPPGRRLPSVRKLASLYRVSTPTVGSAIHALASLGFVRVSRGVGTFVAFPKDQMTLLTYIWRTASTHELALVRAAIDTQVAPLVAAEVRDKPLNRQPRTLSDINFLVHERSVRRYGDPRTFLEADVAFHRAVVASMRGLEIGPALYERVCQRLIAEFMPIADVEAGNRELDEAHLRLASAILAGDVTATARCARRVALDELHSLHFTLG